MTVPLKLDEHLNHILVLSTRGIILFPTVLRNAGSVMSVNEHEPDNQEIGEQTYFQPPASYQNDIPFSHSENSVLFCLFVNCIMKCAGSSNLLAHKVNAKFEGFGTKSNYYQPLVKVLVFIN